ncbi:MAG: shikimate dehydrogenase [Zetaproteobacteria bacterium]|nr:shikimate dehydrogenase [Zetaproteobacteria bacterium]
MISGASQLYGIIGQPVKHSLSPVFQNQFIIDAGIDAAYLPFDLPVDKVHSVMESFLHLNNVQGLNVTIPFKEQIVPWVKCDAAAQSIGAVNTVKRVYNEITNAYEWHATNTDWKGVVASLTALHLTSEPTSVLLFGAGGTSKAILYALASLGNIVQVFVCNRNFQRAEALVLDASLYARQMAPGMQIQAIAWDQDLLDQEAAEASVWINATAIGLHEGDPFPFVPRVAVSGLDMVYRPDGNSAFCKALRLQQSVAIDGLLMLLAQGAASFAYWHNASPAFDIEYYLAWMQKMLHRSADDQ